jgi:hypothetical protein
MEQTSERRMQQRFPYKSYASYMKLGDARNLPDIYYTMAEVIDICGGGVRLRLPQPTINDGTLMITKIPLTGISASLPVLSKVQWVAEETKDTCIVGIKFVLGN